MRKERLCLLCLPSVALDSVTCTFSTQPRKAYGTLVRSPISGKDCGRTILPVVTRNNACEPTDQLAGATWATVYQSAISWSEREGPGRPEKKSMNIDCGDFRWTKIRAVNESVILKLWDRRN